MRPTVEDVLASPHRWYHTIELAPGVVTPGWIDIRHLVADVGLPDDLRGRRALDVGTFDGFWAFELERRGATVVGIDVDEVPPPDAPAIHRARMEAEAAAEGVTTGAGFELLKRYFGSSARRVPLDVHHLGPDAVGGPVDLALVGSLLLHLRDPVGALERIQATLAPGGTVVLVEAIDPSLSRTRWRRRNEEPAARFLAYTTPWTWWLPNTAALEHWLRTAGFVDVEVRGRGTAGDVHGFTHHLAFVHARLTTS